MKYFKASDFACKCGCGYDAASPRLIAQLNAVREEFGANFTIKCGCECPSQAALTQGDAVNAHVKGLGAVLETIADKQDLLVNACKKHFDKVHVQGNAISVAVE